MATLTHMTEIPEEELAERLGEVLERVRAGEPVTVTAPGRPPVELTVQRAVGLAEFLSWPEADRSLLDDIRALRGEETTDDLLDPWERHGDAR